MSAKSEQEVAHLHVKRLGFVTFCPRLAQPTINKSAEHCAYLPTSLLRARHYQFSHAPQFMAFYPLPLSLCLSPSLVLSLPDDLAESPIMPIVSCLFVPEMRLFRSGPLILSTVLLGWNANTMLRDPISWLPLAAGDEFTQPSLHLLAEYCIFKDQLCLINCELNVCEIPRKKSSKSTDGVKMAWRLVRFSGSSCHVRRRQVGLQRLSRVNFLVQTAPCCG